MSLVVLTGIVSIRGRGRINISEANLLSESLKRSEEMTLGDLMIINLRTRNNATNNEQSEL